MQDSEPTYELELKAGGVVEAWVVLKSFDVNMATGSRKRAKDPKWKKKESPFPLRELGLGRLPEPKRR